MSKRATEVQELALAATGSQNLQEVHLLTAASIKKLDDDLRTVNVTSTFAAENAKNNEGWTRWVQNDQDKRIKELKMLVETIIKVMTPSLNAAQKAMIAETRMEIKAMKDEMDRKYMDAVTREKEEYEDVDVGSDDE